MSFNDIGIISIYNNEGRILRNVSAARRYKDSGLYIQIQEGEEGILTNEVVDDNTYYILNGQITPRPTIQESINGSVISNLPTGITVNIIYNGSTILSTNDGVAELVFTQPGTYEITLEAFPYRTKSVTVEGA